MTHDWEEQPEALAYEGELVLEEAEVEVEVEEGAPRRRRRRRRKVVSPAHEARIERYRGLVEERGWIFSPPSPPLPLSSLFEHLTPQQLESLSA